MPTGVYQRKPIIDRFMDKIMPEPMSGCWLWIGARVGKNYGAFSFNGRHGYAHRFSYITFVGAIPDGYEIDHLCKNTCCSNPKHLEAVTHSVNLARSTILEGAKRYYASITHCPQGHPYSLENTSIFYGKRHCKECRKVHTLKYDMSNREKRMLAARAYRAADKLDKIG